jgi:hypothetical protein
MTTIPIITTDHGYLSPQLPSYGIHPSVNQEESKTDVFEKAKTIAKRYNGECISNQLSICKGKNSLKFKCQNNHIFFLDVDVIEQT